MVRIGNVLACGEVITIVRTIVLKENLNTSNLLYTNAYGLFLLVFFQQRNT
jgi:hypothetical protein